MNEPDPYAILKMVFVARFGVELSSLQGGGQAQPAPGGPETAPDTSGQPDEAQGGGMDMSALTSLLEQSEAARKAALTEQLTQAAMMPPVSEQEAAILLNAALSQGGRDAVALGG